MRPEVVRSFDDCAKIAAATAHRMDGGTLTMARFVAILLAAMVVLLIVGLMWNSNP